MKSIHLRFLLVASFLLLSSTVTHAAINCNVTGRNLGELYDAALNNNAVTSNLSISCTRAASDPSTIYYSITASFGNNSPGGVLRRVTGPAPQTPLLWILRHQIGGASCVNTTNWGLTNVPGLLTGSLSFAGAALTANATVGYCMEVRGTAGGNPAAPTAGVYIDTVMLTPEMSTIAITGPYDVTAPTTQMSFTVAVGSQCVVRKPGNDIVLNYTAFGGAQGGSSAFQVLCSNGLDYQATVSAGSGTIAGINYTVVRQGALNRTGTGTNQTITINVNAGGSQAGTCATSQCSGTQAHTLTLTY
jgi:hypothetical protein